MVFIRLFRLLIYLYRKDEDFRFILITIGGILIFGSLFYSYIEGWSILDSLYFLVMTMSTVGYGDLTPTTPLSKGVTIFLVIIGIGLFVSMGTKIANGMRKGHFYKKHGKLPDQIKGEEDASGK